MSSPDRQGWIDQVLSAYRGLPHVAARTASRHDRETAATLYERGISLLVIRTAFALAILRRANRDPRAKPLPLIRSLAYFLPVINEIADSPLDPSWAEYLFRRVQVLLASPK